MSDYIWLIVILFILADVFLFVYVLYWRKKRAFTTAQKQRFLNHWNKITSTADLRHAVIDADKLLDLVMKQKGYHGHLGEMLKVAPDLFSDLNGVWFAHKLRNRLAHELDIKISESEAKMALGNFKRALRDLGAL